MSGSYRTCYLCGRKRARSVMVADAPHGYPKYRCRNVHGCYRFVSRRKREVVA